MRLKSILDGCRLLLSALLLWSCASPYTVSSARYQAFPGEINQHRRIIDADGRRIFKLLTDAERIRELCPQGTIVSYLSPSPYDVGHVVETRIEHIFKLKWTSRVVALVPFEHIRLQFEDGFFKGGTEIWEFEPEGSKTLVTHTIVVQPRGWIRKQIWRIKIRKKHDIMVEQFLDNLKQSAEQDL